MFDKIKKWWFNISHTKCDYCRKPVEYYYEAYLFPHITEYKGHHICLDCILKLRKPNI